jgi:hypothetical protein
MSYDLAVWEGERPVDHAAAGRLFAEFYERYVGTDVEDVPTPKITKFVELLVARWPDLSDDTDETSPWSTDPLISEASGPFIYFPMRYSMYKEAVVYATEVARSLGLVCFDPQDEQLL